MQTDGGHGSENWRSKLVQGLPGPHIAFSEAMDGIAFCFETLNFGADGYLSTRLGYE